MSILFNPPAGGCELSTSFPHALRGANRIEPLRGSGFLRIDFDMGDVLGYTHNLPC